MQLKYQNIHCIAMKCIIFKVNSGKKVVKNYLLITGFLSVGVKLFVALSKNPSYPSLLHESMRLLGSRGEVSRCLRIMEDIARINGREMDQNVPFLFEVRINPTSRLRLFTDFNTNEEKIR